ncbi:hypothetical protein DE146DRAFT_648372 [Phaeosphaeria sp. MPI-PUGE-AT-0046c]|nr:hypothetical protein DE146DRAFT_648372 [Phaeosphaeria sp. MPI-PUGE-AT-0046c]
MAEPSALTAEESSHQSTAALEDNLATGTQDTIPPSEHYKPLPQGCWILEFHGNCPRCRHHHRAAEVQVKVTEDPGQVSYVRCEKCQEKWAAFGGRNTTRISLLSTTTTEPDNMDRAFRYSLVQIVKVAVAKASLGTLPESSSLELSLQPSETASTSAGPHALVSPNGPAAHSPPEGADDIYQEQHQSLAQIQTTPKKQQTKLLRKRDRTIDFFFNLKIKLTNQLSRFRKAQRKLKVPSQQPAESVRQSEQSQVQTAQCPTQNAGAVIEIPATEQTRSVLDEETVGATDSTHYDADKPTARLAEVVTFIAKLDKDVLASLNDQERVEWMRKTYTEFKNRNKTSLRYSSITETSITPWSPPMPDFLNRRSAEVFGAGLHHIEGLNDIVRRHSIATSDGASERLWDLDDSTAVSVALTSGAAPMQRPRPEIGLPPSFLDRLSIIQTHRRSRRSLELSLHSRVGSLTSLPGHARSRLSQGSMTVYGSMTNIPEMLSHYHGRRTSNPEPSLPRPTSS